MDFVEAIVLGLLQGITEWLPVSSEAVLALAMTHLFGQDPGTAVNNAIWLHTGTMLAALLYFRTEFLELFDQVVEHARTRHVSLQRWTLLPFLVVATGITGVVGGIIYLGGLQTVMQYPDLFSAVMGIALFGTGLARFYTGSEERRIEDITATDTVLVGVLQGLAILPGVSRSGSTVFGLLYRRFSGADAFKLSFLLSVPAVLAANIGMNLFSGFAVSIELGVAAAVSFLVGYVSIDAVLRIADHAAVAYLCFGLGILSFLPILL